VTQTIVIDHFLSYSIICLFNDVFSAPRLTFRRISLNITLLGVAELHSELILSDNNA
jgi:hypothetical protein